jgi:hypothetical protein
VCDSPPSRRLGEYGVWRGEAIQIPGQKRGGQRKEGGVEQTREERRREARGLARPAAGADQGGRGLPDRRREQTEEVLGEVDR